MDNHNLCISLTHLISTFSSRTSIHVVCERVREEGSEECKCEDDGLEDVCDIASVDHGCVTLLAYDDELNSFSMW